MAINIYNTSIAGLIKSTLIIVYMTPYRWHQSINTDNRHYYAIAISTMLIESRTKSKWSLLNFDHVYHLIPGLISWRSHKKLQPYTVHRIYYLWMYNKILGINNLIQQWTNKRQLWTLTITPEETCVFVRNLRKEDWMKSREWRTSDYAEDDGLLKTMEWG